MIPGVIMFSRKASVMSVNGAEQRPLKKLLSSKENLDWLKIDLNMAKIITGQDYKRTKN